MKIQFSDFNWMKFRVVYLALSAIVIGIGIISILKFHFLLGVEFTGGTSIEYKFEKNVSTEDLAKKVKDTGVEVQAVQKATGNTYLLKLGQVSSEQQDAIKKIASESGGMKSEIISYEQVGPSVSQELIKKTLYALLLATIGILGWIAYQFKSFKFGVSATVATLHDALVVIGLYSLLGHFFKAEVDFLFVTALLTVLSFSVHDTIIVYDRIREIRRKHGGSVSDVANRAISETMRRSLFNSLTIVIMLASLSVLGGSSIHWFAVTLLIGTISGTYSSPFVAVSMLVTWEEIQKKLKK